MAVNSEEYINKMYDSSLESQKQTLQQDYDQNAANLDEEQKKAQKQTDTNLTRTYVEAAKAAKNYGEVQNAYGLTSGAQAQAKLAQGNQLQADMTAIRAAQQEVDADVERQRTLLAKEYAAAIQKAQADNDLQRAQALYEAAKEDEAVLLQKQKEAGNLMAGVGDYSILAQLYELTDAQVKKLQGDTGSSSAGYYGGYSGGGSVPAPAGTGTGGTGGSGSGSGGLTDAKQAEIENYVEGLLNSGGSAAFRASDIIAGSSKWSEQEKAYAQEYLKEYENAVGVPGMTR